MAAGSKVTIFRPKIKIAPVGSPLPSNSTPAGGAWPVEWVDVENTEEGAMITVNIPKEDVNSDENGTIAVVPEGEDQVNIAFTSLTPEMNLVKYLSQFAQETVAGTYEVQTLTVTGTGDAGGGTASVALARANGGTKTYNVAIAASATATAAATAIAAAIQADGAREWEATASAGVVTLTAKHYANYAQSTGAVGDSGLTSIVGATTTPGVAGYKRYFLDNVGKTFMIGIEGTYGDDSLFAVGGMVRAFGYEVEQTEEVELQFRRTGEDAPFKPAANVRCLKTVVDASQITGSGISTTDDRFDMFAIPG